MIRCDGNRIVLSGDTSIEFLRNALNQNPEVMRARDSHQQTLDRITLGSIESGFSAEIPDLIIPEKIMITEYNYKTSGSGCEETPFVVKSPETVTVLVTEYFSAPTSKGNIYDTSENADLLFGSSDAAAA